MNNEKIISMIDHKIYTLKILQRKEIKNYIAFLSYQTAILELEDLKDDIEFEDKK